MRHLLAGRLRLKEKTSLVLGGGRSTCRREGRGGCRERHAMGKEDYQPACGLSCSCYACKP